MTTPKVHRPSGAAGGDKLIVESGGEIEVKSGGEVDVESGGFLKLAGTAITASAAELNLLDGVTATTAELNLTDSAVTDGAALVYTTDNKPVVDKIAIAGERIKLVVAAGGNAKTGTFYVTVSGPTG